MKRTSICRRCHRVRLVDWNRICESCNRIISELGQPKTRPPLPGVDVVPETVVDPIPDSDRSQDSAPKLEDQS